MHVQFTTTDSTGSPVTSSLAITLDGERYEIDVAETGTARVPEHVGKHLIDSPDYAVAAVESDAEPEVEADAESEADDGREIERAAAAVVSDDNGDGNGDDEAGDENEN